MAAALHPLDDKDVLFEHHLPLCGVARAQVRVGVGVGIKQMYLLLRAVRALGRQHDGKGMVAVHTQKHVWVGRDILRRRVPLGRQSSEIPKGLAVGCGELTIDMRALSGIAIGSLDMIVILEPGIAVEAGMHPGQVIAFAVILDRQLPVTRHVEGKCAVRAAMIQRGVEFRPAGDQVGVMRVKRGGITAQVDPDNAHPDMAAHLQEAQLIPFDTDGGVLAGPAHMRRRHQPPLRAVTPAVVRAAQRPFDLARRVDQDHAPVPADVVEDADNTRLVAQQQKRHAQEIERLGITRRGHIRRDAEPRPFGGQYGVPFFFKNGGVRVVRVRQPVSGGDRAAYRVEIGLCHDSLACLMRG